MPSYMCPYLLRTISESTLETLKRGGGAERLEEEGLYEHLQLNHTVEITLLFRKQHDIAKQVSSN